MRVAIYCRVSTLDQSCERQERDLLDYAQRAGYLVVGIWKETSSGIKLDLPERKQVMVEEGYSYRDIAKQLQISKNTVGDIVKRNRESTRTEPDC